MEHPQVNDTICAISTAPGVGGIAVARVSGPEAIACVSKIWKGADLHTVKSHTAHLGDILDSDGVTLDQAVVTVFRAPSSFTGEDTVEISVHGSQYVQRELIKLLVEAGARLAEPGEFTRRAFASGRFDLAEAEAVADLIAARSRSAHRLAMSQMRGQLTQRLDQLRDQLIELASLLELELDFSEEDVEFASRSRLASLAQATIAEVEHLLATFSTGQAIKEGIPVAIVGATNAGKSTLLNRLVGDDRAIVSDIHGTTRDTVEDTVEIHGTLYRIIDTAGLRDTTDPIEALGIERSRQAVARARVVIALLDATAPLDPQLAALSSLTTHHSPLLLALNKSDVCAATGGPAFDGHQQDGSRPALGSTPLSDSPHASATHQQDGSRPDPGSTPLSFGPQRPAIPSRGEMIPISAKTGDGISALLAALREASGTARVDAGDLLLTHARHAAALTAALAPLHRVAAALAPHPHTSSMGAPLAIETPQQDGSRPAPGSTPLPLDLVAQDLREAIHHISSITTPITTPDLLATIFSRFCVGK